MQGVMGTMLEKNMAAFAELQSQFINQSKGLYDPKHLSPELWTQFLGGQAPVLQNLMGSYVEQSRSMFEQMQKAGQPLSRACPASRRPRSRPGRSTGRRCSASHSLCGSR
jgi:polyhydroxyalkanoate synthesis regulator protein